jgi:hypothetical protein
MVGTCRMHGRDGKCIQIRKLGLDWRINGSKRNRLRRCGLQSCGSRPGAGSCGDDNDPARSIQGETFLEHLRDCQFLKKHLTSKS